MTPPPSLSTIGPKHGKLLTGSNRAPAALMPPNPKSSGFHLRWRVNAVYWLNPVPDVMIGSRTTEPAWLAVPTTIEGPTSSSTGVGVGLPSPRVGVGMSVGVAKGVPGVGVEG